MHACYYTRSHGTIFLPGFYGINTTLYISSFEIIGRGGQGYWTTRGYANSWIANSQTGPVANTEEGLGAMPP